MCFVVLNLGNSNESFLGAQGTIEPSASLCGEEPAKVVVRGLPLTLTWTMACACGWLLAVALACVGI